MSLYLFVTVIKLICSSFFRPTNRKIWLKNKIDGLISKYEELTKPENNFKFKFIFEKVISLLNALGISYLVSKILKSLMHLDEFVKLDDSQTSNLRVIYLTKERKKPKSDEFLISEYSHKVILFGYLIVINFYIIIVSKLD